MVGANSADALSMFSIVNRSPRRWSAFPPTATTMRSCRGCVEPYDRRADDDDDDDGAILNRRTRRCKEVILLLTAPMPEMVYLVPAEVRRD